MANENLRVAPYGCWRSPISSGRVAASAIRLGQPALGDGSVYWTEIRPEEKGRVSLVRWDPSHGARDLVPPPFSPRSRVHEYGGGALVVEQGRVYFTNDLDQRVYSGSADTVEIPRPLTPEGAARFADFVVDHRRGRLLCVREDHSAGKTPTNTLVSISLGSGEVQVMASGADFYSSPCISPDGQRLAWLSWSHPNMPWDGCELWVSEMAADGPVHGARLVAGGVSESIFQPQWSPEGYLHFISDRTGWWNLWREVDGTNQLLLERKAEFGLPQWVLGQSTYGFLSEGTLLCTFYESGAWHLAVLDTATGRLDPAECPYTEISDVRCSPRVAMFRGSSPVHPPSIVRFDVKTGQFLVLRQSFEVDEELGSYFSMPEPLKVPGPDGRTIHAQFYPPFNPGYKAPDGELPPLLVTCHGGPTGAITTDLSLKLQYWTSRGFGFVDVAYGGSTGWGRAYREALRGHWGELDVDDCVTVARHLAGQHRADATRLLIRGGSAGGYTVLRALASTGVFRAGACFYGISDLEALALHTHKFESRYLDSLIGPYPEARDLYRERSPIYAPERLSVPVILFQGSDDRVVPPEQAERFLEVLRSKGVFASCLIFEGEAHGFRRAETIRRVLEAELGFYGALLLHGPLPY